eukprot:TRINITY_DN6355_c0_g1_i2.p1 TRINITY_DN6355_c0_g1~~TRINITY_DN6355_c0_g1_i2.p1  ORF type:complete len:170 (+),score=48.74 TRINITY_DN6355_c0_g1_i2:45-554(+)
MLTAIRRVSCNRMSASLPTRRLLATEAGPSVYKGTVTSTGGRNGSAKSSDNNLSVQLSMPKSLGGAEAAGTTNPEQLFAAGYSACFLGAMGLVAPKVLAGKKLPADTTVTAEVDLHKGANGLSLSAQLLLRSPSLPKSDLQKVGDAAHQVCPYSLATRGNVPVTVTALD